MNNHCENAWQKLWPKNFKKKIKKSLKKIPSLRISEFAFSLKNGTKNELKMVKNIMSGPEAQLNNHCENALQKSWPKNFNKKIKKSLKKILSLKNFWICFFAVKRHLEWTYWWKIHEWSSTHLNNHCENAWQKLWPKNFKKKIKKSLKKILSLWISEFTFSL